MALQGEIISYQALKFSERVNKHIDKGDTVDWNFKKKSF